MISDVLCEVSLYMNIMSSNSQLFRLPQIQIFQILVSYTFLSELRYKQTSSLVFQLSGKHS
jgi:hypothetical protein